MIENIRKYNFLIILGLVVVGAALVIGLNTSNMRGPGGQPYIKIGSRTYSDVEYSQLGYHGREIITTLAQSGDFQRMYQALFSLSPTGVFAQDPSIGTEQFFINRILIQQAKKEFGIHPSKEEISDYTRSLISFQNQGEFDPERYARFLERALGPMGLTEKDFRALISDIIATAQIRSIVSAGLLVDREATARAMALDSQQISGSVARLELAPFKDKIQPTEEELKAYWELIQDAFTTAEERRFSYILAAPDVAPQVLAPQQEEEEEEEEDPNASTQAEDGELSEAQKASAERRKAREEAREKARKEAAQEAERAEAKRKRQFELNQKFDKFVTELLDDEGRNFEALAAKHSLEIKTTGMFTADNPPVFLDLTLRNSKRGGTVMDELFRISPTDDPLSRISEALPVGEDMWLVARVEEIKKSRPKTFEEAREEVRAQYIQEEALKALDKAIDEAAEKVESSLKEGKDFIEAAIDAGLNDMEPFSEITSGYQPEPGKQPSRLFPIARAIDPGALAEPLLEGDTAYLVFVSARTVVENENHGQMLDREVGIAANTMSMAAFSDWLKAREEAALIERYYRPQ